MSKAIREALKDYSRITGKADTALADWEAIERAARAWVDGVDAPHKAAWINEIVEAIAKDAPP